MAGRYRSRLGWSDVTPKAAWVNRRQLIAGAGAATAAFAASRAGAQAELQPNTFEEISSYNNFYEFGTDKGDPKRYAQGF
jgi:methionine sulfoxide reductase catalytic subunit